MIRVGKPVPDVRVWRGPDDALSLRELAKDGAYLLLFYLLDWTST